MMVIELENGSILEVTPEHRFFVNGEWVAIEHIAGGEELELVDGEKIKLKNAALISKSANVFNFDVEDKENYFVTEDGVLVHNGYREDYLGRTPSKSSKTGQEVFERMLNETPPSARIFRGQKQFWDPDNKVWRNISEADMGHLHDAVTYWNQTGKYLGAKSKEVREWMLDSDNYKLEYFRTNRSRGAILGQTANYEPPVK